MLLQNDWQPCMIIWIRSKYWLYEEFCIWMCSWLKSKGQALDIFTWARNPIVGQSALVDYNPGWLEPLVLMMKKKSKIMVCIHACGKKLGFFSKKMLFLSNKILQKVKDSEDLGGWLLSKREKFDLFKVMTISYCS